MQKKVCKCFVKRTKASQSLLSQMQFGVVGYTFVKRFDYYTVRAPENILQTKDFREKEQTTKKLY